MSAKVLLLNPPYRIKLENGYERFFVRAGSRWPYSERKKSVQPSLCRPFPFFLAYTAALLRDNGCQVDAIDGVALQYEMDDFSLEVSRRSSDVAVIEIAPFSIEYDLELARIIKSKNKDVILIAVGPFISLMVDRLKEKPLFDFAVNGEYEFAVLEIVNSLKASDRRYSPGIIDLRGSQALGPIAHTSPVDDLDKMPVPAYDIFPSNDRPGVNAYWDVFCQLRPAVQMQSSRGCPYRCYFCLWNQVVYDHARYRTFSAARVVDEMESAVKTYKAKEIYFDDDDFTIDKTRVGLICRQIQERGLKVKWSCMADAINLDETLIREMARSGCIGIKFGIESADERVLRGIGKPVDLTRAKMIVECCKIYGIRTHATYSFGLLNETLDSMEKTLKFAQGLDTDSAQFSIATPYPGTVFYKTLRDGGMIVDFDWMNYDGSLKCVVNYPQLKSSQIEDFYARAFRRWFMHNLFNPGWFFRQMRIVLRTACSQSAEYNIRFLRRLFLKLINR